MSDLVSGIRILAVDEPGPLPPPWVHPTEAELLAAISRAGLLERFGIDPMQWHGDCDLANEVFGERYGVDWEYALGTDDE